MSNNSKSGNDDCKLSKHLVEWHLPKKNVNKILIGSNFDGLLYKKFETAGKIEFSDFQCKLEDSKEKVCDKTMTTDLKFKNGNSDSVLTPLGLINYHTHPISCYVDGETIWGWPSGEDLKQCITFARDGNLSHIIFAVEGTYIIDVNKNMLKYLDDTIEKSIELIFQITHNYRIFNQNCKPFYEKFCKEFNIKGDNIVICWIKIVNSLTINNIIKLWKSLFSKKLDINLSNEIKNIKIYNVQFIKNNTIQWNKKLKNSEIFSKIKSKNFKIDLPKNIIYKAPFVSEDCKI